MLDLQRMFQQPQRQTQDMPMQSRQFDRGDRGLNAFQGRFGDNTMRLGDLFKNVLGQFGGLFGNHSGQPSPQTPGTPTPQAPQPMGNQYSNPFGASVTGGTLGAMLARQPTY